jgi:hypothetical protein
MRHMFFPPAVFNSFIIVNSLSWHSESKHGDFRVIQARALHLAHIRFSFAALGGRQKLRHVYFYPPFWFSRTWCWFRNHEEAKVFMYANSSFDSLHRGLRLEGYDFRTLFAHIGDNQDSSRERRDLRDLHTSFQHREWMFWFGYMISTVKLDFCILEGGTRLQCKHINTISSFFVVEENSENYS